MGRRQLGPLAASSEPAIQLRVLSMLMTIAALSQDHFRLLEASGRSLVPCIALLHIASCHNHRRQDSQAWILNIASVKSLCAASCDFGVLRSVTIRL